MISPSMCMLYVSIGHGARGTRKSKLYNTIVSLPPNQYFSRQYVRCEMSREPNWPFAYEKYDGDSLETKVSS